MKGISIILPFILPPGAEITSSPLEKQFCLSRKASPRIFLNRKE